MEMDDCGQEQSWTDQLAWLRRMIDHSWECGRHLTKKGRELNMATWRKKMLGSARMLFLAHALLWSCITVRVMLSVLDPQALHDGAVESAAILLTTGCFALLWANVVHLCYKRVPD